MESTHALTTGTYLRPEALVNKPNVRNSIRHRMAMLANADRGITAGAVGLTSWWR